MIEKDRAELAAYSRKAKYHRYSTWSRLRVHPETGGPMDPPAGREAAGSTLQAGA
jgi:hypothetical protein